MSIKHLDIASSPHIKGPASTDQIMIHVALALLPALVFGFFTFGLSAFLLVLTTVVACVGGEWFFGRMGNRNADISDGSALVTGLLLGMTLPPGCPLWTGFLGGIFAIGIGKFLFGGLGRNLFNPALAGRAILQAAFPVIMTTWVPALREGRFLSVFPSTLVPPFTDPIVDATAGATPLGLLKFEGQTTPILDLAYGITGGSSGETASLLLLLGGLYLAIRKMLDWRIPVGILAVVAAITLVFRLIAGPDYPHPMFMLFSGGLMLGAIFMATDMVTSPVAPRAVWAYAMLIGFLVCVIRFWGGLPEGVMYAILMGNALSPLLDRVFQPRVYGHSPRGVNS